MDIYCPKRGCAEPFELDCLHDAVDEGLYDNFTEALHAFQSTGCEALGYSHNLGADEDGRADVMGAMFDLLGDDIDGAAAMLEDFVGGW